MQGICRLCLEDKLLKESHVWSSFLYKDYVADLAKGGQVIGVFPGDEEEKRQVVRNWLCHQCEQLIGKSEAAAARLFRRVEDRPAVAHSHDGHLLRFATSISWRVLQLLRENMNRGLIESEYPACRYWRHFLNRQRSDVAGFTQHAFVIFDHATGMHRRLSGAITSDRSILVAQAGPLLIVSRLARLPLSKHEENVWRKSELPNGSGTISILKEWRIGENITRGLHEVLWSKQGLMSERIRQSFELAPTGLKRRRPPPRLF